MTKLMHIADLHLGRKFDNLDMLDDQRAVLDEILTVMEREAPDGLLIGGDVYDRAVPSAEAVTVLDSFLSRAAGYCPVFLISGNHDSGERLAFASGFLRKQNLHMAGAYEGVLSPVRLKDVNIYMLPYTHPGNIGYMLGGDAPCSTMEEAVNSALSAREEGDGAYNVLIAHLFVKSSSGETETCDSEAVSVGTLEQVDISVFEGFDYVALGHLHRPQWIGRETVRYSGTPLAYSFSEDHEKSVTVVEMEAGQTQVRTVPLKSGHRMRTVTGYLQDILQPGYDRGNPEDYILVKLLDDTLQMDAKARLLKVFPLLIGGIQYPDFQHLVSDGTAQTVKGKSDDELIGEFWRYKRGGDMPEEFRKILTEILKKQEGERA